MKKIVQQSDGWSEVQAPIMSGYRMGCCDCGLVHDLDFSVVKITKRNPDGSWDGEELPPDEYRVTFKARRNKRSTSAARRKKEA